MIYFLLIKKRGLSPSHLCFKVYIFATTKRFRGKPFQCFNHNILFINVFTLCDELFKTPDEHASSGQNQAIKFVLECNSVKKHFRFYITKFYCIKEVRCIYKVYCFHYLTFPKDKIPPTIDNNPKVTRVDITMLSITSHPLQTGLQAKLSSPLRLLQVSVLQP